MEMGDMVVLTKCIIHFYKQNGLANRYYLRSLLLDSCAKVNLDEVLGEIFASYQH